MTNLIKLERGSIGNRTCGVCNEMHVPQNRCSYEALVRKITKLSEANSLIPSILSANKEAVNTATQFQAMLKQADKSNDILMEILASHGTIGEQIKNEYLGKVDEWASKYFSQDTKEQTPDTESSTPSETSDKPSTEETTSGESSLILF